MIEKIKASKSEKIIFIFVVILGLFSITSYVLLKNKCLFVKNYDPNKINFENFSLNKLTSGGGPFFSSKIILAKIL